MLTRHLHVDWVTRLILPSCAFAGLEHASNLAPGTLNEGSKYLSALICNEVCRARKTNLQDSREVLHQIKLHFETIESLSIKSGKRQMVEMITFPILRVIIHICRFQHADVVRINECKLNAVYYRGEGRNIFYDLSVN